MQENNYGLSLSGRRASLGIQIDGRDRLLGGNTPHPLCGPYRRLR
jgi:hypothetical protein